MMKLKLIGKQALLNQLKRMPANVKASTSREFENTGKQIVQKAKAKFDPILSQKGSINGLTSHVHSQENAPVLTVEDSGNSKQLNFREHGTGNRRSKGQPFQSNFFDNEPFDTTKEPWWIPETATNGVDLGEVYGMPTFTNEKGIRFFQSDGQKAKPFFFPAVDEEVEKLPERLGNEIQKGLENL